MEFVITVELVIELNDRYAQEITNLSRLLNPENEDLSIGEEADIKTKLERLAGKQEALQDLLETIKEKTNVENN